MKKLYYFSKSKLQFIEIKSYKAKLAAYFTINSITNPESSMIALKAENDAMKQKLIEVVDLYKDLNNEIDSLRKYDKDLRLAVDLESVSDEEKQVGVGGGYFDNSVDFLNDKSAFNLKDAILFVDEVSRKIAFEKSQYSEIEYKLNENKKLYAAIPAIKPCEGPMAVHGFGMRFHPILGIRRMHEGIDILADRGTPVHAAGDGTVDFVGYKGGYGLTVEIDHGFGYRTVYAHLSKTITKKGSKVKRGELIAKTGSSGLASGPHLHYEVHHNGVMENPKQFFFDDLTFFDSVKSDLTN